MANVTLRTEELMAMMELADRAPKSAAEKMWWDALSYNVLTNLAQPAAVPQPAPTEPTEATPDAPDDNAGHDGTATIDAGPSEAPAPASAAVAMGPVPGNGTVDTFSSDGVVRRRPAPTGRHVDRPA